MKPNYPFERDAFKQRVPKHWRGTVANWFLMVIRTGVSDPYEIVTQVSQQRHGSYALRPLVSALVRNYPDEAYAYAEYLAEFEGKSKLERRKKKKWRYSIRDKQPTLQQVQILSSSFSSFSPNNRLHAHDVIEALSRANYD
jgi:hypothetical protein